MSVVPLGTGGGLLMAIFRSSVTETVSEPHEITESPSSANQEHKVLTWNGWSLNTRTWVLSSEAETSALSEVVYYLGPGSTEVYHVVLVFGGIVVRVDSATFLARFAGAAVAENVVQATIPGSMKNMETPSQEEVSATAAMAAQFPAVHVGFDTVVHGSRANTAIAPRVVHIVSSYAGPRRTRTMYFGHYQTPRVYMNLTYGGKQVWSAESLAAATLTLVVGPVLDSHWLNEGYATLPAGRELELTRATPTDCFVGSGFTLCPATGRLLSGLSGLTEFDLAEVLYVPSDGGWACILNFRPVKQGLSFALQLGAEATDMLMLVAKARFNVLTSTAIHGLARSLPPWPNAHSQGTTNAPVVSSLPSDHPSLMPVTRARMIWAPGSAVVRYEPVPSCAQYAGNRTDRRGWAVWPLCAADAAARARSPACDVFKECAPSQPVASTASLIDARNSANELVVQLYDSKETGVLYGLTPSAVYVVGVRPRSRSGPVQADVVVATEKRTERYLATKESRGFKIVAARPPCASLAKCMKGTDLSECYLWAQDCADTEDRSPIVARLEYNGALVELRELDAEVMYGIDSRGAFALHVGTGSVIFAPGIKAPAWPREERKLHMVSPLALKASYDAGTWRVGWAGPTPEPKSSSVGVWIGIGLLVAVAIAVVLGIYVAIARRRTLRA